MTDLTPCFVAVALPWLALNISALVVGVVSGGYAYRLADGVPTRWRRFLVMPFAVMLGWLVWGLLALAFGYVFFGALDLLLSPVC